MSLPIDRHHDEVVKGFQDPGLVIVISPPGTGKSTRIPLFLSQHFHEGKVVCVEPRRIAARSLAHRVASERGETVGESVGYRVRFEQRISRNTCIEFVSRGVFLRQLLENPGSLGQWDAILLDEFHERQLETDWIFGEILRHRSGLPRLRVGILSATLDPEPVRKVWGPTRLVEIESPLHPVEIRHSLRSTQFAERTVVDRSVEAIAQLAQEGVPPNYLTFLPGYREVREAVNRLRTHPRFRGWEVLPLTGEQSADEQDRALNNSEDPRIVVATNIAESSLTVAGVKAVVDAGLARRMDFEVGRGLNVLRTVRVSLFSARQRTGRAGRIGRGVAVRLWSEKEEQDLPASEPPECQRLELSDWLLRTHANGVDPDHFPWIDPPPPLHIEQAAVLLEQLGCLRRGQLTARGQHLASFPVHPRLAAVISNGMERGVGHLAARLAALEEEDPILISGTRAEEEYSRRSDQADFEADIRLLQAIENGNAPKPGNGARLTAARQVLRQASRLERSMPPENDADEAEKMERLRLACLAGFPDRVARALERGTATYQCRDGTSARIDRHSRVQSAEWIVFLEKRELIVRGTRTAILGSIVNLEDNWIRAELSEQITTESGIFEDPAGNLLRQTIHRLGAIEVARETHGPASDSERASHFAKQAAAGSIPLRRWTPATDHWLRRVDCLRLNFPELEIPVFDEDARIAVLELVAYETATAKEFRNAEIRPALEEWLGPEISASLDTLVPETFLIPGRKRPAGIDYSNPEKPRLSIRIQEAMKLEEHPLIGSGRIRLVLELLAPNQRPVQITENLAAFWENSYPAIRKELRGRYPKHDWPEKVAN